MIKIIVLCILVSTYLCNSLPIVIFHGFGDQCSNPGMQQFTQETGNKVGVRAECIEVGNGAADSITMNFEKQAELACENLKNAGFTGDITVMGLSQGALLARYIVESCDFNGQVKKLISIGGPMAGVGKIPRCDIPVICPPINWITRQFVYMDQIQQHVGPAGYFRDPFDYNTYVTKSTFLSTLNNQKDPNSTDAQKRKSRLSSLDLLVLGMFNKNTMIFPKETAQFGFYKNDGSTIEHLEDSDDYANDVLGLKTLNEAGKITKVEFAGNHLQFTNAEYDKLIVPLL